MTRRPFRHLEREKARTVQIEFAAGVHGEHLYTWDGRWCARAPKSAPVEAAIIERPEGAARKLGLQMSVPRSVREMIERAEQLATDPRTIARRRLFRVADKRRGRSVIVAGVRVDADLAVHAAATAAHHEDEQIAVAAVTLETTSAAGLGSARCLVLSGREWVMAIAPIVIGAGEVVDA